MQAGAPGSSTSPGRPAHPPDRPLHAPARTLTAAACTGLSGQPRKTWALRQALSALCTPLQARAARGQPSSGARPSRRAHLKGRHRPHDGEGLVVHMVAAWEGCAGLGCLQGGLWKPLLQALTAAPGLLQRIVLHQSMSWSHGRDLASPPARQLSGVRPPSHPAVACGQWPALCDLVCCPGAAAGGEQGHEQMLAGQSHSCAAQQPCRATAGMGSASSRRSMPGCGACEAGFAPAAQQALLVIHDLRHRIWLAQLLRRQVPAQGRAGHLHQRARHSPGLIVVGPGPGPRPGPGRSALEAQHLVPALHREAVRGLRQLTSIRLSQLAPRASPAVGLGAHAGVPEQQQHEPASRRPPGAPPALPAGRPLESRAGCCRARAQARRSGMHRTGVSCPAPHPCSAAPSGPQRRTEPALVMVVRKHSPEGCRPLGDQARAETGLLVAPLRSGSELDSRTRNSGLLA